MSGQGPLDPAEAGRLFTSVLTQNGSAPVVIACSGGPDSTALLGLYALAAGAGALPRPIAATVDHGLRAESGAEAESVAAFAASLGVAHHILPWRGAKPQGGVQAAARIARYRLLHALALRNGARAILTAHTLDDQAETVLMRLLRGSGPQGLAGMAERTQVEGAHVLRPFLGVAKARLVATCAARGWPTIRDPSNENPVFQRPRLRRLMPELAREGLSAERLATLANRLRRANEALDALAVDWRGRARLAGSDDLDAAVLARAPQEAQVRLFAALLSEARAGDPALPAPRLERIERLADAIRRCVDLGQDGGWTLGGRKFTLRSGRLRHGPAPARRGRPLRQSAAIAPFQLGNDAPHP